MLSGNGMIWLCKLTEKNEGATYCQKYEGYICYIEIRTCFFFWVKRLGTIKVDIAHISMLPTRPEIRTPSETNFDKETLEYDGIYYASWKPEKRFKISHQTDKQSAHWQSCTTSPCYRNHKCRIAIFGEMHWNAWKYWNLKIILVGLTVIWASEDLHLRKACWTLFLFPGLVTYTKMGS